MESAPHRAVPRLACLLGAPRSGTTWLQGLLGAHPNIVTPQETDLFSRYVAPLDAAWRHHRRGTPDDWVARRLTGLPAVLTTEQFRDQVRSFIDAVLVGAADLAGAGAAGAGDLAVGDLAAGAGAAGAPLVLEKSPSHSTCVSVIVDYVPDTRFVHLVRDGRDVVGSLLAASEGWGANWAPPDLETATQLWVDSVTGARRATTAPGGYHEVRYEELRGGGAAALAEVFAHRDISVAPAEAAAILDANSLASRGDTGARLAAIHVGGDFAPYADRAEPEGFFRSGTVGGWRTAWSAAQRNAFDEVGGDLLVALGYETDRSWVGASRAATLRRRARQGAARIARGAGYRAARWIDP